MSYRVDPGARCGPAAAATAHAEQRDSGDHDRAAARDGERGLLNAEFAVQENCSPPVYYSGFSDSRTKRAIGCLDLGRRPETLRLLEEASANHEKDFEDFRAEFTSGPPRDLHGPFSKLAK